MTSMTPWLRQCLKHRQLLIMFMIPLGCLAVFRYAPMWGLMIAFKDFRMSAGLLGSEWNGLQNFAHLISGGDFLRALRNTVVISVLRLSFGFAAPIVLALLLNELRLRWYKRTVQTLTYLPFFFSWVILGGIFRIVFSVDGPVNDMLTGLGLERIQFLAHKGWFLAVLIGTGVWQTVGYGAVIYLAALAGIPPALYEAAMVDGAGRWRQTLHITLPSLVPTIVVLFILNLGHLLDAGFDQVYNLYNPIVYETSDILDTYVLRRLITMDYSLGTAAGLLKSVVALMLVVAANSIANRVSGGEHGVW